MATPQEVEALRNQLQQLQNTVDTKDRELQATVVTQTAAKAKVDEAQAKVDEAKLQLAEASQMADAIERILKGEDTDPMGEVPSFDPLAMLNAAPAVEEGDAITKAARAKVEGLQKACDEAQANLNAADEQVTLLDAAAHAAKTVLDEFVNSAQARVKELEEEVNNANAAVVQAEQTRRDIPDTEDSSVAQAALEDANRLAREAQIALDDFVNSALGRSSELEEEVKNANTTVEQAQKDYESLRDARVLAYQEINNLTAESRAKVERLTGELETATAARDALQTTLDEADAKVERLTGELETATAARDAKQGELTTAQESLNANAANTNRGGGEQGNREPAPTNGGTVVHQAGGVRAGDQHQQASHGADGHHTDWWEGFKRFLAAASVAGFIAIGVLIALWWKGGTGSSSYEYPKPITFNFGNARLESYHTPGVDPKVDAKEAAAGLDFSVQRSADKGVTSLSPADKAMIERMDQTLDDHGKRLDDHECRIQALEAK